MAREYFCAYHSLLESLKPFTDAECGRLFRIALQYSAIGEAEELRGNERFIWPTIKQMIDRDISAYEAACEKNRENGSRGGRPKNRPVFSETPKSQEKDKEEDKDEEKEKASPANAGEASKRARGEYGWVKLSDAQYAKLLADLGAEELARCIAYVDESAQKTENKNKWKDWNLVLRNCHRDGWGLSPNSGRDWGRNEPPACAQRPIDLDALRKNLSKI